MTREQATAMHNKAVEMVQAAIDEKNTLACTTGTTNVFLAEILLVLLEIRDSQDGL